MTIRTGLRQASSLRVDIYDAAGHLVRRLHDGFATAGELQMRWDGADDRGAMQAAGVYLVRARAGFDVCEHRIVLLK